MTEDDAELIKRWQHGDADAFEDLVRRWHDPVGRLLARLVGRADIAQDLNQEVFLRVYRVGQSYQENGAFQTWLYRIALNVARDSGRRERRQPKSLDHYETESGSASPDMECQQQELLDGVTKAVAELPENSREVLVLRHYEDMSFAQMSRLLDVPASTLKSRFTVALRQLRVRLRQLGLLYGDTES
ncbi:MAG: sigma-70 family RNA polymerase sigma factor [Planctomycetes bacterium]|nr:sigma-70 family RNA polymerase sigma factor [Planctomycetota bacterium]